jgi:ribosome-associated protein
VSTIANPPIAAKAAANPTADLVGIIAHTLDEGKAEEILVIDLEGKTSIADYMIIATGSSQRQVGALADQVMTKLKELGMGRIPVEGKANGDWVLLDAGDVIVHLFRPEVRSYYNLEKIWAATPTPLREAEPAL